MSDPTREVNYTVPVLIGGLAGAALTILPPFCCLCCLNAAIGGGIAGGMLARAAGYPPLERGALVGALAGALTGVGYTVLDALWNALTAPLAAGWVSQLSE